jgi:hypothetical protein
VRVGVVTGNSTNVGEAASPTLEFSRLTYITGAVDLLYGWPLLLLQRVFG